MPPAPPIAGGIALLRRLRTYLEKIFGFRSQVEHLRDTRQGAQIPTGTLWRSVFWMFCLRLRSFHALEQELRRPGRWEKLVGPRKPSADALGYGFARFDLDSLRDVLQHHHRVAWRKKAVHGRAGQRMRVVAIDGHELGSSEARCCPQCLVREVTVKVRGQFQTVRQYYHRVVVAQWVGVTPPGILDLERVRPGEGETVAARRLWDRLVPKYGRLIDVVTLDAIYLEAPFLQKVLDAGKHFIVVLKQENRDLYQDADGLRRTIQPQVVQEGRTTSRIWDLPGLTTFSTLGHPVRVVWAEEQTQRTQIRGGKKENVLEAKTWIWVTDLSADSTPARAVQRWGHDRWDVENRGFNELMQYWGMDHCFVHDPTAIEVLLLTLALAFLVTVLFYERNLKPPVRRHLTRLAWAQRLREDLVQVALQDSR